MDNQQYVYDKFIRTLSTTKDHAAMAQYHERYDNEAYLKIVNSEEFRGDTYKANKLIDQCLAVCGHTGFSVDNWFIRHQSAEVILYIHSFI